jgi:hypothetical protein
MHNSVVASFSDIHHLPRSFALRRPNLPAKCGSIKAFSNVIVAIRRSIHPLCTLGNKANNFVVIFVKFSRVSLLSPANLGRRLAGGGNRVYKRMKGRAGGGGRKNKG